MIQPSNWNFGHQYFMDISIVNYEACQKVLKQYTVYWGYELLSGRFIHIKGMFYQQLRCQNWLNSELRLEGLLTRKTRRPITFYDAQVHGIAVHLWNFCFYRPFDQKHKRGLILEWHIPDQREILFTVTI